MWGRPSASMSGSDTSIPRRATGQWVARFRAEALALSLAVALILAIPAAAGASTTQESLFQDDSALIFSTHARRVATLDELRSLGVDTVRTNVLWNWVVNRPNSTHVPKRVKYDWFRWDELVRLAGERGIAVQLTMTGP